MNEKLIAVYGICNTLAIGITNIKYGIRDKITSVFISESGRENIRTTNLYSSVNGYFFVRYGVKYYINDFMRL